MMWVVAYSLQKADEGPKLEPHPNASLKSKPNQNVALITDGLA